MEFNSVSLTQLVDSPLIAGDHYRQIGLNQPGEFPVHVIDMVSESEAALAMTPQQTAAYHLLVAEAGALFGARHYTKYHFLYTLSDEVGHHGLEHHESSDNSVAERTLIDPELRLMEAGLLPHEFVHSWNGKYRRPAGLATPSYQEPMIGDLLWVYEGLTEYLGNLLTARSKLWTPDQYREALAETAAVLDHRAGRTWRTARRYRALGAVVAAAGAALAKLAPQSRLLPGRRAYLAGGRHSHPAADSWAEVSRRFLPLISWRPKRRSQGRSVHIRRCC